jgi:hypothetical protein
MNTSATLAHLANRYTRHYFAATTYSPDPTRNSQHMAIAKRLDAAIRYLNGRLNRNRGEG